MGMTLTQKILSAKLGGRLLTAGELIEIEPDLVLGNDITAPVAIEEFARLAGAALRCAQLRYPERVTLVMDHFAPNKDILAAENCKSCRSFAEAHGIERFFDCGEMGIEHVLLPEKGMVTAGDAVIGADSHTCTYGALGAFSTGVGSTDLAAAMVTGKCWLKVPQALQILLRGKTREWVSGKDVILHLIGKIGVEGARYQSLEFSGAGAANLTMDDRLCICNMAVEAGAKNGIFAADAQTLAFLREAGAKEPQIFAADADASYARTVEINLDDITPTVAFPHLPENAKTFGEFGDIPIQQVVIGSCTNGRLSDLACAAAILQGKKVAKSVRVIVIPGTQRVYLDALKAGYIQTFIEAGAAVSTPTCGPCLGGHMGVLAAGERAVSTTNRNFVGRMGSSKSEVYLASPAVAAASALTGKISQPSEIM